MPRGLGGRIGAGGACYFMKSVAILVAVFCMAPLYSFAEELGDYKIKKRTNVGEYNQMVFEGSPDTFRLGSIYSRPGEVALDLGIDSEFNKGNGFQLNKAEMEISNRGIAANARVEMESLESHVYSLGVGGDEMALYLPTIKYLMKTNPLENSAEYRTNLNLFHRDNMRIGILACREPDKYEKYKLTFYDAFQSGSTGVVLSGFTGIYEAPGHSEEVWQYRMAFVYPSEKVSLGVSHFALSEVSTLDTSYSEGDFTLSYSKTFSERDDHLSTTTVLYNLDDELSLSLGYTKKRSESDFFLNIAATY